MKYCYNCRAEWKDISQPGAHTTCPQCGNDLHSCLNCRNYSLDKPNQCKILDIDLVQDKDRANYCDEFQFFDRQLDKNKPSKDTIKPDVRAQWDKLFKK